MRSVIIHEYFSAGLSVCKDGKNSGIRIKTQTPVGFEDSESSLAKLARKSSPNTETENDQYHFSDQPLNYARRAADPIPSEAIVL
jgi:hypothetical protein